MGERHAWLGHFLFRCTNCPRATLDAEVNGWRFYADDDGNLHAFCRECSEAAFGDAESRRPPIAVCPRCPLLLHPQPRGGWVCKAHGLVTTPRLLG